MIAIYLLGSLLISALLFINRNKRVNYLLVGAFALLQWVLTIYEFIHRDESETYGYFKSDALALLMLTTLSIITIPAFYHSYIYFNKPEEHHRERGIYFMSIVILLAAVSGAYLSNHIAVTWVFVELTTLAASGLVYHHRDADALEGTWKYIFVCSISITFVFIGILFLSIALQQAGHADLSYPAMIEQAASLEPFWLRLAFIFIFTGFTAKLGLVPMYTAGIDAKDKAPSPAGALFSSVLMNMGFVGIFRFYEVIAKTSLHAWANQVIFIAAVLSVFVATVYMLKVQNIKRMLAYSSIEHMGLVMLGVAAGGIGYYAAILHLILHAFTKASMFFQIGQVYRIYKSKHISDTGNYFKYNLAGALALLLAFICATAMPPSGLFISEFMIFRSLFEGHHLFLFIVVLLLLTMIIWALGKSIFRLLFLPPVNFDETRAGKVSAGESVSQFILLGLVIYLGFNPPLQMVELIQDAVKNLPH
ncbi:MAG: hypothetical protein IPG32_18715 [Saprospirales bacterium]|jgi:hydrogenase-4 component F|nr:hypothetical protein [Saprospirales bacterium]